MARIFVLFFLLGTSSCAHYDVVQDKPAASKVKRKVVSKSKLFVRTKKSQKKRELVLQYKQKHYRHWLKYFAGKNKKRFLRQLRNGDKYREIVRTVFKKHGLPEDLFYVGLIESGFYTHARSHASAVGPWQFIRGTGKRYKLRIDRHVDERRSIYKSTEAAAQYFKDLYNIFGSWELALCAYNAGEYRIINAIRKGNTRNYKELVRKRLIPRETIFYIPKVVAARHLDKKWKRRLDKKKQNFYTNVDFLKLERTLNVAKIAKNIGVSWKTIKKLNPDLNSYWIRPRRRGFVLYLPKVKKQIAINHLKSLGYRVRKHFVKKERSNYKRRYTKRSRVKRYRVRRGDNLSKIAKKFDTTVRRIKKKNRLRSGKILAGQRLRIPASAKRKYYVVRKGDNLTRIAQRFGVSIKHILRLNRLKNPIIYPYQKILIPSS